VIEIISPTTASKDKILKVEEYYKAGVRAYWIVDFENEELRVYDFENGNTQYADLYTLSATVASFVIEGLMIDFADVMKRVRAR
jgi:Uma2 family endonuclease